ncbi:hypothetical protein [Prosthecobacter sp.]|uniref:hypothetical protein n=1 Tax=Prosthecobacter sp. TaxID=1965333 RepID=UPI00248833A4|nr:hypothetical protein [Prosthecobacter sp.]MDI1312966.1 hypothetical protein [Prosthecobacter sp.]
MSTNPDPFENDLRALQRRALPPAWREEMLGQAAAQAQRATRTPRWLLASWGVAWAATLVLYFTTPSEPAAPPSVSLTDPALPMLWQQRAAAIEALLAAN